MVARNRAIYFILKILNSRTFKEPLLLKDLNAHSTEE